MEFILSSKMKCMKPGFGGVSGAMEFWMKLYYLQCEQFQFIDSMLFGQVRLAVFGC